MTGTSDPESLKNKYTYFVDYHSHGDHVHFNLGDSKPHNHDHGHHEDHHHHDEEHDHHHEKEEEKKKKRKKWFSSNKPSQHDHIHKHKHKKKKDDHCDPCDDHDHDHGQKNTLGKKDEGCPCCAAAIDLDEVAAAIHEIASGTNGSGGHSGDNLHNIHVDSLHSAGEYYPSPEFWGIFLGISGPLALIGLTAAIRNVKGTINNRKKLNKVIHGLNDDIKVYEERIKSDKESEKNKQDLKPVVQRLKAFRKTLKYSRFDANFNLAVPGFLNGAASTAVLSTSIVSSPWALPLIGLYAGFQTVRNAYDLKRTWNEILPTEVKEEVALNVQVGNKKINQITRSKRKFYAANTAGFSTFTIGAAVATVAVVGALAPPVLFAGIGALGVGAISTGYLNNKWTNKFKPRNSDLGIEREKLHLGNIPKEIADRREVKLLLKNYRRKHLPKRKGLRRAYSLKAALPFKEKRAAKQIHKVNQSRVKKSNAKDKDRLDLLERIINIKTVLKATSEKKEPSELLADLSGFGNISSKERRKYELVNLDDESEKSTCEKIFDACKDLGLDKLVIEKFIKNEVLHSHEEHDTSVKNKEQYFKALKKYSDIFDVDEENGKIDFKIDALEDSKNSKLKESFMNSLEEAFLFDHLEKLRYEQYGLNDFYWALKKQVKKDEKNGNNIEQKDIDFDKIKNIDDHSHEDKLHEPIHSHDCSHHHHNDHKHKNDDHDESFSHNHDHKKPSGSSKASESQKLTEKNIALEIKKYTDNSADVNLGIKSILDEQVNSQLSEPNPTQVYKGCGIKATFKQNGELVIDEIFADKFRRFGKMENGKYQLIDNSLFNNTNSIISEVNGREIKNMDLRDLVKNFHDPKKDTNFTIKKGGEAYEITCKKEHKDLFVTKSCEVTKEKLDQKRKFGDKYNVDKYGIKAIDPKELISKEIENQKKFIKISYA